MPPKRSKASPKPPPKPKITEPAAAKPPDPHRLVRRAEGYASEDGRFEVSGAAGSWYLADSARPNPLGLPTIEGPYRTLGELRAAVAAAVEGDPRV